MNGQSKTNERLHDITPNGMVLVKNKYKRKCNTHLILIRLQENCIFRGLTNLCNLLSLFSI